MGQSLWFKSQIPLAIDLHWFGRFTKEPPKSQSLFHSISERLSGWFSWIRTLTVGHTYALARFPRATSRVTKRAQILWGTYLPDHYYPSGLRHVSNARHSDNFVGHNRRENSHFLNQYHDKWIFKKSATFFLISAIKQWNHLAGYVNKGFDVKIAGGNTVFYLYEQLIPFPAPEMRQAFPCHDDRIYKFLYFKLNF